MNYQEDVLMVGNGAGFQSVEALAGVYQAFVEKDFVPGKVMSSSGSTLFSSLFYSKSDIDWVNDLVMNHQPSDYIQFKPIKALGTALSKTNYLFDNSEVEKLLKENMTGEASLRVTTSVTRNADWSSHMRQVTPGWALAATSIPLIFKPVMIGGELWSDGGLINNLPVPPIEDLPKYKHVFIFVAPRPEYRDSYFIVAQLLNMLDAVKTGEIEQLNELGYFTKDNVTLLMPEESYGGGLLSWSDDYKMKDVMYNMTKEALNENH